jgi:tRNA1Val (adenine37-N6)-methyltransferase
MANNFFRFKQFLIRQEKSGMKVCTDACLFGAWSANRIGTAARILDIGGGTGLLILMLAQKSQASIDGIEIEPNAHKEAMENIEASPWKERCRVFSGDVRIHHFNDPYDFIISNPPFYEASLKAGTAARNLAMHSEELKLEELLQAIDRNLSPTGEFAVLLPYARSGYFENLAVNAGFALVEQVDIRQAPGHDYFRSILHFSRRNARASIFTSLTIEMADKKYSPEFVELLKDYYLYL